MTYNPKSNVSTCHTIFFREQFLRKILHLCSTVTTIFHKWLIGSTDRPCGYVGLCRTPDMSHSLFTQPPIYPSEVASSRSLLLLPCQTGKLDLGLQGDPCRWGWRSKDTTPQFTLSYGKCTGMCLGGRAVVQRVSILKLPGETRMPSTAMTKGSFSENQTESCLL
jgi:hypothetical protein